jgi:phenylalanine-4-hydroxylase
MKFKNFTPAEHETWKQLFQRQVPLRSQQLVHEFEEGIEFLGLNENGIPDLDQVNQRLKQRTGFQGVPVTGHEDPRSFFPMLSERLFPIGNFIRDARDINYTPAPDVFHDLYGHLPFLADPAHADFQQEFGKRASAYIHDSHKLL